MPIVDGGDAFSTYDDGGGSGDIYTMTAQSVATDVQEKFGDTGQVQITDTMLLRWINAAQQEIASNGLTLEGNAVTNLLAGQSSYSLAAIASEIRDVSQVSVNGNFIEIMKWNDFSQFVGSNASSSEYPSIGALYAGKLVLWPAPSVSVVQGLNVYYSAYPAPISSLSDPLSVPDRFYQAMCDRVLSQALELDENFDAAQVKQGHFESQVTKQLTRIHESPTDYYSAVEPSPEWL